MKVFKASPMGVIFKYISTYLLFLCPQRWCACFVEIQDPTTEENFLTSQFSEIKKINKTHLIFFFLKKKLPLATLLDQFALDCSLQTILKGMATKKINK